MNTRTKKGRALAPPKKVSPKRSDPEKNPSSTSSAKKKSKPALKQSEKSSEAGKKSVSLKKAVRKNLPSSPAPAVKKKAVNKPPSKPAGVKAKTVKKKVATPKVTRKTAEQKPLKAAIPKASPAAKKSPRAAKKKVSEKTIIRETAGTKKTRVRVLEPAVLKQKRKAGSEAKGPEKKSAPRGRGSTVLENIARAELPEEYGENELIVIAVDPNVVFVDWEIKKEKATEAAEGFTMRVFDVTGSTSPELTRDVFFTMKIEGRVGSGFFELRMPGREVAIEIGLNENGRFLPILRCPSVSMPRLLVSDELGIAEKMFGSALPVGY